MKKITLIFTIFICQVKISSAQNIDSIVHHAANSFLNEGPRIGVSVGVISKDRIYQYYFGSAEKGLNTPPAKETIYEIGSITKTFTSMLLAQAVIDKKLSLSDDIRKYLKGNYPNLEYKGKPIRLIHLANLTSGLPDNLPEKMPAFKTKDRDSQLVEFKEIHDAYSRQQFLTDLNKVKLIREPGLTPSHSNTAAELMGFILENVYGASYGELLKKYITAPLSMTNTFVLVPDSMKRDVAKGYNSKGIQMPEIPIDAGSAGALKSSLPDMIKYINHQLNEKDKRVILQHHLEWGNMGGSGNGLNWRVKTNFDGKRKIWTSGGTFGFSSYGVLYPERDFAVVVLSNQNDNGAEDALSTIAETIYNELYFTAVERSSMGFGFSESINSLLEKLNSMGFEHANEATNELKAKNSAFKLTEDEMNAFGYHLLKKGERNRALEIFKLNVNLYPKSSNTYDSLAETYESMGNKDLAIQNYKRSLELNPSSSNAVEHLNKLKTN